MIEGQRDEAIRKVAALGEQDGLFKLASPGQAYAFFGDDASGHFAFFRADGQISQDVLAVDYGRARMYFGLVDGDAHGLTEDEFHTDDWDEPIVKHVIDGAVNGGSGTTYAYYGDDASGTMMFVRTDASLGQQIDGVFYDRANMYVGIVDGEQHGLTEDTYWYDGDEEVEAIAADIMGFAPTPEESPVRDPFEEYDEHHPSYVVEDHNWVRLQVGDRDTWRLVDSAGWHPIVDRWGVTVKVEVYPDSQGYTFRISQLGADKATGQERDLDDAKQSAELALQGLNEGASGA